MIIGGCRVLAQHLSSTNQLVESEGRTRTSALEPAAEQPGWMITLDSCPAFPAELNMDVQSGLLAFPTPTVPSRVEDRAAEAARGRTLRVEVKAHHGHFLPFRPV